MKRIKERSQWEIFMLKPLFVRLKQFQHEEKKFKQKRGEEARFKPHTKAILLMDKDYEYEVTKE